MAEFGVNRCVAGCSVLTIDAGHVAGAVMFLITIDSLRVVYSGDFSGVSDIALTAFSRPNGRPHLFISEGTLGL